MGRARSRSPRAHERVNYGHFVWDDENDTLADCVGFVTKNGREDPSTNDTVISHEGGEWILTNNWAEACFDQEGVDMAVSYASDSSTLVEALREAHQSLVSNKIYVNSSDSHWVEISTEDKETIFINFEYLPSFRSSR